MKSKTWIAGVVFGFVLSASLIYTGCQGLPAVSPSNNPSPQITQVQTDIKNDGAVLTNTTAAIKTDATAGQQKTPAVAKAILDPYWLDILLNVGKQDSIVTDLANKDVQLQAAVKQVNDLKTFADGETKRANTAEANVTSQLRKNLNWLIMGGIVGIAVSAYLIYMGQTFGIGLAIASGSLTAVSIFVSSVAQLVPWIIGGVILAGLGYGIYMFIKNKKTITTQAATVTAQAATVTKLTKVGAQLVSTIENTKQLMVTVGRKKMFGDGAVIGLAHVIQDEDTKKFVAVQRCSIEKAPAMPVKPTIDYTDPVAVQPHQLKMAMATADIWTCQLQT